MSIIANEYRTIQIIMLDKEYIQIFNLKHRISLMVSDFVTHILSLRTLVAIYQKRSTIFDIGEDGCRKLNSFMVGLSVQRSLSLC